MRAFLLLIGLSGLAQAQYNPYYTPAPINNEQLVHFASDNADDHFRVTIGPKSCTTPCALALRSGSAPLKLDAGWRSDQTVVDLPPRASTVRVSFASRANYISGALALVAGVAATSVGLWFAAGQDWDGHIPTGVVASALGVTGIIVGIIDLARAGKMRASIE
jgi:hypothetical protein